MLKGPSRKLKDQISRSRYVAPLFDDASYFWIDDLGRVERNLSGLERTAEKYSLVPYRAVAMGFRGRVLIRVGQTMDGICHLQHSWESACSAMRTAVN
jgi:hypothetical protein